MVPVALFLIVVVTAPAASVFTKATATTADTAGRVPGDPPQPAAHGCSWRFVGYRPSAAEAKWHKDSEGTFRGGRVCDATLAHKGVIGQWMKLAREAAAARGVDAAGEALHATATIAANCSSHATAATPPVWSPEVEEALSMFDYEWKCTTHTGTGSQAAARRAARVARGAAGTTAGANIVRYTGHTKVSVPVEPLVGPLRDPRSCFSSRYAASRDYLISSDWAAYNVGPAPRRHDGLTVPPGREEQGGSQTGSSSGGRQSTAVRGAIQSTVAQVVTATRSSLSPQAMSPTINASPALQGLPVHHDDSETESESKQPEVLADSEATTAAPDSESESTTSKRAYVSQDYYESEADGMPVPVKLPPQLEPSSSSQDAVPASASSGSKDSNMTPRQRRLRLRVGVPAQREVRLGRRLDSEDYSNLKSAGPGPGPSDSDSPSATGSLSASTSRAELGQAQAASDSELNPSHNRNLNVRVHAPRRALLFDVGSGTYLERQDPGPPSQPHLVGQVLTQCLQVGGLYAWEAQPLDAGSVWSQIPAALKPVYHWFNIPASFESRAESTEVDGTLHWMTAYHGDNPLHHIRTVAAREDFVVLKLDVDDPEREVRWVQQLLSDQDLLGLVDELYWECHANMTALEEPAKLLSQLRHAGVRAHTWA